MNNIFDEAFNEMKKENALSEILLDDFLMHLGTMSIILLVKHLKVFLKD